jgi:type VII secretion-associated serine protease mycosin
VVVLTAAARCAVVAAAIALPALPTVTGTAQGQAVVAWTASPGSAATPLHAAGPGRRTAAPPSVRPAEQPQLRETNASAAWRVSTGAGVTVGVLDTGTDPAAPDLAGSVTTGPDYTQGANPPGYQPPRLHGTYIASLVAGHGSGPGRTAGVIGVAPSARVLSVRVILDDQEPGFAVYNENSAYDNAIGGGIRYAVNHGAGVINMSLGGTMPTRNLRQAVGYAISRGVVVVAAAGNNGAGGSGVSPYSYPASYPGVISVAAVGANGARASFSERNASVVISAPGVNVIGAGPGGTYLLGSGTSPASAIVAGAAALIRSRYPRLSPALVEQALISSARERPPAGYSPGVGFGEVDTAAALAAAGRLAAEHPAAGMPADGHFGKAAPGPIQVVHRDTAAIAGYGAAGILAALGFLALLALLVIRVLRPRAGRAAALTASPDDGYTAP